MNTAAIRTVAFSRSHCSRQPACEDSAPNLTLAALKGDTGLVTELLKAGADPDACDGQGRTPLIEAAFGGHVDTLSALLGAGADPNARDADGWTPLMEAASKGRLDVVRRLLAAAADVNASDRDGRTAVEVVARGHLRLTRLIRGCSSKS
ncbi:MAG TPA: ankyrin repeat domain-containing protein [Blastocatellia bacterium]|nr:ankyrin repeat domain-containing protein [Blastocatellia bacterium]